MEKTIIRRHYTFTGWVQGVGFRWRAKHAAAAVGATGWVRNEFDGSVTMELQGTEEQLASVLLALDRGSYIRIEGMDVRTIPVDPEERRFRTEY